MSAQPPRNPQSSSKRTRCAHTDADGTKCCGFAVNKLDAVQGGPRTLWKYCSNHRYQEDPSVAPVNRVPPSTPQVKFKFEKPAECPICCMDDVQLKRLNPCEHWCCIGCTNNILKSHGVNDVCPFCRTAIDHRTPHMSDSVASKIDKPKPTRAPMKAQRAPRERSRSRSPIGIRLQVAGMLDNVVRNLYEELEDVDDVDYVWERFDDGVQIRGTGVNQAGNHRINFSIDLTHEDD